MSNREWRAFVADRRHLKRKAGIHARAELIDLCQTRINLTLQPLPAI
jgi:hypothetical protein